MSLGEADDNANWTCGVNFSRTDERTLASLRAGRLNRGEQQQRISPALSLRDRGSRVIGAALPRSFTTTAFEFQGNQSARVFHALLRAATCYLTIVLAVVVVVLYETRSRRGE